MKSLIEVTGHIAPWFQIAYLQERVNLKRDIDRKIYIHVMNTVAIFAIEQI